MGQKSFTERYTLPNISNAELVYRPLTLHEAFADDIYDLISTWVQKYNLLLTKHTASSILESLIQRLESESHRERKAKKAKS